MTVPPSLCRLCITTSNGDFKSLYDEYDQANDVYEIVYEYFHPKIVDMERATHLTAICLQCFHRLHDFHSFKNSVLLAQLKLEEVRTTYTIAEEIQTPQGAFLTQTMAIKVENEEFIGCSPDYRNETDCTLIMENEFVTLPDLPTTSIRRAANEAQDRKDNISLPKLEIIDIDESCTSTKDADEIPLAQVDARNPPLTLNRSSESFETQTIDCGRQLSHSEPNARCNTLYSLLNKWIPNIKCYKCSMSFPTWSILRHHFKRVHPEENFRYICCSRKFTGVQVKEHLRLHEDPAAFKCSICGNLYTTYNGLTTHYAEVHPALLKYACDKCDKRFYSIIGLATHSRKMHKSDRQDLTDLQIDNSPDAATSNKRTRSLSIQDSSCNTLDEKEDDAQDNISPYPKMQHSPPSTSTYNIETTLSLSIKDAALQNVDEDRNVNISLPPLNIMDADTGSTLTSDDDISLALVDANSCSSESVVIQTIENQKSSYDRPEKFRETLASLLVKWIPNINCFKCSKSFPFWPQLKSHFKLRHPNETFYYVCCSRKFSKKVIKDHLILHSDPDAFKCLICHKRYTTKNILAAHNAEIHPKSFQISCDKCGMRFRSKLGLATHHRKIHQSNRQDHAKILLLDDGRTAFNCQLCGETKYSKATFRRHKCES